MTEPNPTHMKRTGEHIIAMLNTLSLSEAMTVLCMVAGAQLARTDARDALVEDAVELMGKQIPRYAAHFRKIVS